MSETNNENKSRILDQDDPKILERLRVYEKHEKCMCLECGYDGLMGIMGEETPWYYAGWIWLPIIIIMGVTTLIGGIGLLIFWILSRGQTRKQYLFCPNCESKLSR